MTLHKKRLQWVALAPILLMALVAGAGPPNFEITRSTIDGGGVMRSTGGDFELSGTIGQPDASVMVGDDFELTGGFWFAIPPGDYNGDGGINLLDLEPFIACGAGPGAGLPDPLCASLDRDNDGDVDVFDFAGFQAGFTG